jgi:leucyl aminopeptidase
VGESGGALTAKLITSGETRLVVDLTGTGADSEAAARLAFAASARGWRYDKYRTKLTRKQKPTLEEIVIVGAGDGKADGWRRASALLDGLALTRELVTEPANIIYPESFVARAKRTLEPLGVEIGCSTRRRWPSSAWARCSASARARRAAAASRACAGTAAARRKPIAFVGKGVTFDTGGISIKPAAGMEDDEVGHGRRRRGHRRDGRARARKAKANVVGVCGWSRTCPTATPSARATS